MDQIFEKQIWDTWEFFIIELSCGKHKKKEKAEIFSNR